MKTIAIAAALEVVYQVQRTPITRCQFIETLQWAYNAHSPKQVIGRFMREVAAGCYDAQIAKEV